MSKMIALAPGLSLLIQGLLEFAPLLAGLVKGRQTKAAGPTTLAAGANLPDLLAGVNTLAESAQADLDWAAQKRHQQQLAAFHRQTQLQLAAEQRATTLQWLETQGILANWPLWLYPSQLLASHPASGPLPLRIFLSLRGEFTVPNSPHSFAMETHLAQGLREFLSQHYPLQSATRPTEFLAGAWENQRFHSEASIKALFGTLQSEPTLVLESALDGQFLTLRVAYWGPGQATYYYKTLAQWSYPSLLKAAARAQALAWKTLRDQLLALGEDPATLEALASVPAANLEWLTKETFWQSQGVDLESLRLPYQIDATAVEWVGELLIRYHCLVAAWMADSYHLIYRDVPPLLPTLLPQLMAPEAETRLGQPELFTTLTHIARGYEQIYQALEAERRYWVPELALQFAQSLSQLPDPSLARQQLTLSLQAWLQLRQIEAATGDLLLDQVLGAATVSDRSYLADLQTCLAALADTQAVAQIQNQLDRLTPAPGDPASPRRSPLLRQGPGHLLQTFPGYSGRRASLAITPVGDQLVSSSLDQHLQVWGLPRGEPLKTLPGHHRPVSSLALSPDGQYLASSSQHCPKSKIRIWDWQTGKILHDHLGHRQSVRFVAMDARGRIVAGSGDKIKLWDIRTGKRLGTLSHLGSVHCLAITADGQTLATGCENGKIRLWRVNTGKALRTLKGHTGPIHALAFGADGETLYSASADQTLRVWHFTTGELIVTLKGHDAAVNAIALHTDRNLLISGGADTTVKFWRLDNWALQHTLSDQRGAITSLALSADGQFLASGSTDHTVKLWHL
ncbi:MAG TPA: WD40 repeat domain-containing protein [Leptolyngbyaceae cyanobacterium M65_K2018_010]|nr:WD40 repeat domain-containing protein [Leptolyngbyaceae cyanobacterium M65_K2018_010]